MSKAKSTQQQDLTRPKLIVRVPSTVLRMSELAYLRSLANPLPEFRCHPSSSTLDKLRFLDLIAIANREPSKEVIEKANKERLRLLINLREAIKSESWDVAGNITYQLTRNDQSLKPIKTDVLTDKGKALLQNGEVTIRVRKAGCV